MAKTADPRVFSPFHVEAVKKGDRVFEDAFQGVSRMILDAGIRKVTVKGKTTYQFDLFSQGKKHLVGMYDEINSFVSFVKDASEGGSSREMAFVLVGEPGNGKTFFVEYLCAPGTGNFLLFPKTGNIPLSLQIWIKSGGTARLPPLNPRPMKIPWYWP